MRCTPVGRKAGQPVPPRQTYYGSTSTMKKRVWGNLIGVCLLVGCFLWISSVRNEGRILSSIESLQDLAIFPEEELVLYQSPDNYVLCLFPPSRFTVASGPAAVLIDDNGRVVERSTELGEDPIKDRKFIDIQNIGRRTTLRELLSRRSELTREKSSVIDKSGTDEM